MTKTEFAGFIREHGPVILDGATGTNLMEAGMPIGVCPESWVLENPQVLLELQRRYVEAGSHIVYASTFTGNRIKLEEYGLQERVPHRYFSVSRKIISCIQYSCRMNMPSDSFHPTDNSVHCCHG